jgi:hypothetical protein
MARPGSKESEEEIVDSGLVNPAKDMFALRQAHNVLQFNSSTIVDLRLLRI